VIFEMTPNQDGTWTYHVLHRFASYPTDGQMPGGGLAMDKSGNFYGTTLGGCSARERFSSSASPAAVGRKPWSTTFRIAPTVAAQSLPRYLTRRATSIGGAAGGYNCGGGYCGTVWKLTPQRTASGLHVAAQVQPNTGVFPEGVIVDAKGHLFGTTLSGGKYDFGVAFEITP
jgi:hypothetical protein